MFENLLGPTLSWLRANSHLALPLLLACWMAWGDVCNRRIPNYLTLGAALPGLCFQFGSHGWGGVGQGLLGLCVGFALMIGFYLKGGMGAGDVKALAALGAWLGPLTTLYLFIYMGLAGIPLILFFLWRRGELRGKVRRCWTFLVNRLLLRSSPRDPALSSPTSRSEGLPYAVALAMGMVLLCWLGV